MIHQIIYSGMGISILDSDFIKCSEINVHTSLALTVPENHKVNN